MYEMPNLLKKRKYYFLLCVFCSFFNLRWWLMHFQKTKYISSSEKLLRSEKMLEKNRSLIGSFLFSHE